MTIKDLNCGVLDIEANGLLTDEFIDYTASPYYLKDTFKLWCVVVKDIENQKKYKFVGDHAIKHELPLLLKRFKILIAHNGINYDFLALKLYCNLDYTISPDTLCGEPIIFIDTLCWSKCLNPDRLKGHSLEEWGNRLGFHKIDWRYEAIQLGLIAYNAPKGEEFKKYHPKMLEYCERDVDVTEKVYYSLLEEKKDWPWEEALDLEQAVMDIITRQSHRGFNFNKKLAEENIIELDRLMEERRQRVEPVLPPKKPTKGMEKDYTPPVKQFKKDGSINAHLVNFIKKHNGKIIDNDHIELFGEIKKLPLTIEPLIKEVPAVMKDTTHIKEWLITLGWEPTEWKERDLSVDNKKQKLSAQKRIETIERYVNQTLNSSFCNLRCEYLKTTPQNLLRDLLNKPSDRPIRVRTNPSFTFGQDKEMCRNLSKLSNKFPYTKDLVEFLTFSHRRNSILGGGFDLEDNEAEYEKGYIANIRKDGRISTPADSCGTSTSRFKHKEVANVPRNSSLFGKQMRNMFTPADDCYQIGYDFDSLEARIEAHYCYKYDKINKPYCTSLIAKKPNDIHTVTAKTISQILGSTFLRDSAKSVKYGCIPVDISEVLTKEGWKSFKELTLNDFVLSYNNNLRSYEFTKITKLWHYNDAEVIELKNHWMKFETTSDHYWDGIRKTGRGKTRREVYERFTSSDITSEHKIRHSANLVQKSDWTITECRFIGWLLSDGYFKWSGKSRNKVMGLVVSISQDESKYCKELTQDLKGIPHTVSIKNNFKTFHINADYVRSLLKKAGFKEGQNKHQCEWVKWVLKQNRDNLEAFLNTFWLADGHKGKTSSLIFTQNKGKVADALMLAGNLTNKRVTFNYKTPKCLVIQMNSNCFSTGQKIEKKFSRITNVFCLSTSNQNFVMKQNGLITLTGNCTYGAQAPKVSKIIGSSLAIGKQVFEAFWIAAAPLKKLTDRLRLYWEKTSKKKFILGIDKRKVPTRSPHSITNSLFQSAGVICAKRAMVIHDRKLKEAGLLLDFFREDWKNKLFCQQMIAYHDEAQLEVSKKLVQFKILKADNEIDAEKERKDLEKKMNKILSDLGKLPDGRFYTAYCLAGELAAQSVKEAGEFYGLNIPLSAGYSVGNSWGNCH